jgi:hypothetical protein
LGGKRSAHACIAGESGAEVEARQLLRRAEDCYNNYHVLLTIARSRVAAGGAERGGCGLCVELSSGGSWTQGVCQISYDMSPFAMQRLDRGGSEAQSVSGAVDPETEKQAIAESFALFDVDGSGEIDAEELKSVAKKLGVPMSDDDIAEAMAVMDEDGSGEVDLEEFTSWCVRARARCCPLIVIPDSCTIGGGRARSICAAAWAAPRPSGAVGGGRSASQPSPHHSAARPADLLIRGVRRQPARPAPPRPALLSWRGTGT